MNSEKLIDYLETSFISKLLLNSNITDVSYNGDSIFYVDNKKGRLKSDIKLSFEDSKDFVRQIANLSEKQFSYQSPQLDVSVGKYRINVVHQSIAKRANKDVINFSIRVGSSKLKITKNNGFLPPILVELFDILLNSGVSIVLGGITGSGKTEFQKYLISRLSKNTRVIVIDNVSELDYMELNPNVDLNIWISDPDKKTATSQTLIRNALRSNPDWLIVAEARGDEMMDVLNSAMTGHPIITTIHALDSSSMPQRMTRMAMMGNENSKYQDLYLDVLYHFRIYVFLTRDYSTNGVVKRYIKSISVAVNNDTQLIYEEGECFPLPKPIRKIIKVDSVSNEFKEKFLKEADK